VKINFERSLPQRPFALQQDRTKIGAVQSSRNRYLRHMYRSLFLLFFTATLLSAQDGKIYHDGHGGFVYFPLGAPSFADEVISVVEGNPALQDKRFKEKRNLVGVPDYNIETQENLFSMGCRGSIVVRFKDNALIDIEGPDLYVFEVGSNIEPTTLAISENGTDWTEVGEISGGRAEVDISPYVKKGQLFYYVRLTDLGTACEESPGAEIDAVGAIGSVTSISLNSSVLFATGQSTLRSTALAELDKVVTELKKAPGYTIRIYGHTDSDGEEAANQSLSERRAESVKKYLVSKGIIASSVTAEGYGETLPVATNDTEEGKQQNRRVNILIVPSATRPYFEEEHNTLMMVFEIDTDPNSPYAGKWLNGYPKPVNEKSFPGIWTSGIDEVMRLGDRIYFFHGDSIACVDRNTRVMEEGFPARVADILPGLWPEGIDMAWVAQREGKVYFVRKGELAIWNLTDERLESGPLKIYGSAWETKIPPGVTASLSFETMVYFFAGSSFYRCPLTYSGLGNYSAPQRITENRIFGPLWPSGLDAALYWDNRYIYFFRNPLSR